jgi:hypothetical protein
LVLTIADKRDLQSFQSAVNLDWQSPRYFGGISFETEFLFETAKINLPPNFISSYVRWSEKAAKNNITFSAAFFIAVENDFLCIQNDLISNS